MCGAAGAAKRSFAEASPSRWRRERDSNPRDPFEPNGFQDRRFQPLTHPSVSNSNVLRQLASNLLHFGFPLCLSAGCVAKASAKPIEFTNVSVAKPGGDS